MVKKILPVIMLILMSLSVFAGSVTRSAPATVTPGQTFNVQYTVSGVTGTYFVTMEDAVSGGCTPSLIKNVQSNNPSFSSSVTAPSSGSCTFSGVAYILTGTTQEINLPSYTVTVQSQSQSCVTGQKECLSETTYRECLSSVWSGTKTCPSGQICSNGECSYECVTGTKECVDSTHYRYCSNNKWQTVLSCPSGETCNGGVCSDPYACVSGTKKCVSDYTYSNCLNSKWTAEINCGSNKVCTGEGICSDVLAVCTSGIKECVGTDKYRVCTNNAWDDPISCGSGKECTGAGVCSAIDDDDEDDNDEDDEEKICPDDNALVNMFADLFTDDNCSKAKDYVKYFTIFIVLIIAIYIFKQFM